MSYIHEVLRKLVKGERFAEDEIVKALEAIGRHEAAEVIAPEPPAPAPEPAAEPVEGASDGAQ